MFPTADLLSKRKIPLSSSLLSSLHSIYSHRGLIISLTKREIFGRYQGSVLGLFWSFLNPLVMLVVYTFVFSVVFKARWGENSESRVEFAVILFIGLILYNVFAEVLIRSPSLIISNTNFVKKIVFPLEILSIVVLGAALFHMLISFTVWMLAYIIFFGAPNLTALYFPLFLLPLCLFALGFSWILSSLGVFLRDLGQLIGLITTILMFLSPIFYPITALPPAFQAALLLNPLTFIIEQTRGILMWGTHPDWPTLAIITIASAVIAYLGLAWFQKTRGGFADVL
ncbi:ABC transporter permease [Paraburkholderia aspalathi]|nr:ABC transporter permease [Paraburkholderia aspalathi]